MRCRSPEELVPGDPWESIGIHIHRNPQDVYSGEHFTHDSILLAGTDVLLSKAILLSNDDSAK